LTESRIPIPMNRDQVIDTWFMEHRAKLIDIAAFLDRVDRSIPQSEQADFRDAAFRSAIGILTDGQPDRAKRVLAMLSDHSTEMPESAHGMKGALGAVPVTNEGTA